MAIEFWTLKEIRINTKASRSLTPPLWDTVGAGKAYDNSLNKISFERKRLSVDDIHS